MSFRLNKKSKILVTSILTILTMALLFLLFSNESIENLGQYVSEKEDRVSLEDWEVAHEELFTVIGRFTCLPIKDVTKPHHDLCVFAIKVADDYYRLEKISNDPLNILNKIKEGQNIEISGELIAPDSDDEYLSLGTIKITGIRYLETPVAELKAYLPTSFQANYISFINYNTGVFAVEDYPGLSESRVLNGEIDCDERAAESSLPLRVMKKEINGRKYCIGASSEGTAGSVVTTYAYNTVIADHVYLIQFIATYPNCLNYPDTERVKCEVERENFDLDFVVDREIQRMQE